MKLVHSQQHLCLQLDNKLSFSELKNNKIRKATKSIQSHFLQKFLSTRHPSYIHKLLSQMKNSHRHPSTLLSMYFVVELKTSKILFFRMSLMDGLKLIQTFIALLVIKHFAMNCLNL